MSDKVSSNLLGYVTTDGTLVPAGTPPPAGFAFGPNSPFAQQRANTADGFAFGPNSPFAQQRANTVDGSLPTLSSGPLSTEYDGKSPGESQPSEEAYATDQYSADTPAEKYGYNSDYGVASVAKMAARVPQREPWMQHENLDPLSFTPDRTRAGMQQVDLNDESDFDTFENIAQIANSKLGGQSNSSSYRGSSSSSYQNGDMGYGDYDPGEVEGNEETEANYAEGQIQGTDNAKKAYNFFLGKGYSPEQAAGMVGVLQGESYDRLDPKADQGDGGNAHGIAQWNRVGSKDRHKKFEQMYGKPILQGSFDEQLAFIGYELDNEGAGWKGGKYAGTEIKKLKTPANATAAQKLEIVNKSAAIFDRYFERSHLGMKGNHTEKQRKARRFYKEAKNSFPKEELETLPSVETVKTTGEGASDYSVPEGPGNTDTSSMGHGSGRVNEIQSGTRNKPLDKTLVAAISRACASAGIDMFTCTSGGQPAAPGRPRTGSTRHDGGRAADGYFTIGKRKLDSKQSGDQKIIRDFLYYFAMQNPRVGVGHADNYMNKNQGGKRAMFHLDLHGLKGSKPPVWYWGGARSKWTKDYPSWLGTTLEQGHRAGRNR